MSYEARFSRSNTFKVAPDKEESFKQRAEELGISVSQFIEGDSKVFGIWLKAEHEGRWPFPPDHDGNEDAYEDDDAMTIVARILAPFLAPESVMVLADVGAEFSFGDTISLGGDAVAVNHKGETIRWGLNEMRAATSHLGSECFDFEWRDDASGRP